MEKHNSTDSQQIGTSPEFQVWIPVCLIPPGGKLQIARRTASSPAQSQTAKHAKTEPGRQHTQISSLFQAPYCIGLRVSHGIAAADHDRDGDPDLFGSAPGHGQAM